MPLHNLLDHLRVKNELDGLCVDLVLVFAATEHAFNLVHVLDGFISGHCEVRLPTLSVIREIFVLLSNLFFNIFQVTFIKREAFFEVFYVGLVYIYAI